MPKLNGSGPEGEGSQTGRKLGKCSKTPDAEKLEKLGKGMGKRRRSSGEKGMGRTNHLEGSTE